LGEKLIINVAEAPALVLWQPHPLFLLQGVVVRCLTTLLFILQHKCGVEVGAELESGCLRNRGKSTFQEEE